MSSTKIHFGANLSYAWFKPFDDACDLVSCQREEFLSWRRNKFGLARRNRELKDTGVAVGHGGRIFFAFPLFGHAEL